MTSMPQAKQIFHQAECRVAIGTGSAGVDESSDLNPIRYQVHVAAPARKDAGDYPPVRLPRVLDGVLPVTAVLAMDCKCR